jgi:phosphoribosylformimino-5-aminoimidazole carboxamide ribotide isomerase
MIVPCIDLQKGRAVQLVRGRRLALTVEDVLGKLEEFHRAGYRRIHVIDLDAAARTGNNSAWTRKLCQEAKRRKMGVWVGGGIRTVACARQWVRCGAEKVIIGSAALRYARPDRRFLAALRRALGRRRVAIALDTIRGCVVVRGWRKMLRIGPSEVMAELEPYCSAFLCTYVDREGTMRGTNLRWFRALRRVTQMPITAAGGIRSRREVQALARMGMDAAVGMALYTGKFRSAD